MKRNLSLCLLFGFTLALLPKAEVDAAKKPNVLLLCIDDLRPELACFGKSYIKSPNIDALAARGRAFKRHYVQAPTCGASRYALLTGTYGPAGNGALFSRGAKLSKDAKAYPPSFPAWFRQNGYTTVSVGKVSHHPGGRGGKDWDQDSIPEMPLSWDRHLLPAGPWQHPRGSMHGLANGEIRSDASKMDLFQAVEGPDSIYPDGLIVDEALSQLDLLTEAKEDKPFFLAVGIIRPHLPFGAPKKYLDLYEGVELPPIAHPTKPEGKTTWHGSGEFMKYNRWKRNPNDDADFATEVRRHYAACVSYADAQVGRVIERLKATGEADNTIVVLWGDHGWHLGEHAIWGKHALFEESLRSPLIISYPKMPKRGEHSGSMVETIDVFPSVCEIAGLPKPGFVDGVSLQPLIENPSAAGHSAIAYAKARTIRTDTHRLVAHKDGYNELYDHRTPEGETRNVATEQPEVVKTLLAQLNRRLDGDSNPVPEQKSASVKKTKTPFKVKVIKDVSYLGKDRAEKLDLYLPEGDGDAPRPAVLIVHGGGWHGGDKAAAREKNIGNTLAAAGYVCASVNFRLSVKSDDLATRLRDIWPKNLIDCKTAVQFLRANADKYRIAPEHVGAIGGSAGGHLVAMLAFTAASDELEPSGPYKGLSTRVQAVVPMYGVHDVRLRAREKSSDLSEADAELCRQASPVTYITSDDPPALILHGTKDALVPVEQSRILHASLKAANVPTELIVIEGAPHSFHLQPKQRNLRSRVIGFFDKHFKK
ncbi:MAG: sulfatase-like hydrolase/transferase [Planctomycetales bacterium]